MFIKVIIGLTWIFYMYKSKGDNLDYHGLDQDAVIGNFGVSPIKIIKSYEMSTKRRYVLCRYTLLTPVSVSIVWCMTSLIPWNSCVTQPNTTSVTISATKCNTIYPCLYGSWHLLEVKIKEQCGCLLTQQANNIIRF